MPILSPYFNQPMCMSDPLLDDHQLRDPDAPQTDFERLTQQLLLCFGGTWLLRAIATLGSGLLINIAVTIASFVLIIASVRVLPYFREAPYPRVMRYTQMVYMGLALVFVIILANINAWYDISQWLEWLRYGLFYGGIALLLVEYYSGFSIHKKESHWQQLYALIVAWILLGMFLHAWNTLIAPYMGVLMAELYDNSIIDWGVVGLYALVAILSWFRYVAPLTTAMRWWAIGYSIVLVLLFVAMEAKTLSSDMRSGALLGAASIGVTLGALLLGRKGPTT